MIENKSIYFCLLKIIRLLNAFLIIIFLNFSFLHAQGNLSSCKVAWENLIGEYTGDCKNGFANGKGEAKEVHHYTGSVKNGMPNGKGICYYSDTAYHSGNFQDGMKGGKGETHYLHNRIPDSIVKGYWNADEFRGKQYTTYKFSTTALFDHLEITTSSYSGNSLTIEISTTSGSLKGEPPGNSGFVLTLRDRTSPTGSIVKFTTQCASSFKSSATYELREFPCEVFGTLSNSETFDLELYKSAGWKVRLFINK